MTKEELIDRINDIEWEDFEAKEAKSELPKNIWETVSAFANTSGGWIVLGIKQNGKKFEISGVDNAEKLEQDFLGTLRSQKFNEPVDAKSMLYHIDGHKVLAFHKSHGKICTMTAVKPEGRFGILDLKGDCIASFREKSKQDVGYINGGYMIVEPEIFKYIAGDETTFEREPLETIANEGQLMAYKYNGFWQCMDTMRDRQKLEELWDAGKAPWKVWSD